MSINANKSEREFERRLQERKAEQSRSLNEGVHLLADAITSDADNLQESHAAAYEVLRRLGVKGPALEQTLKTNASANDIDKLDQLLEDALRTTGIHCRRCSLEGAWERDATGVMVALLDGKQAVALVPHRFGYAWIDPKSGRKTHVRSDRRARLGTQGFCFYEPFPARALSLRDVVVYMMRSLELRDLALIVFALVCSTALGMLLPAANAMLFGPVLAAGNSAILANALVLLTGVGIAQALIGAAKNLVIAGVGSKVSRSVEAASMARLLSLPASFFGRYSAGELNAILRNFETVAGSVQKILLGTTLSSVFSLVYLAQIFTIAPALGAPAALVLAANLLVTVTVTLVQLKVGRRKMALSQELSGWQNSILGSIRAIRLFGVESQAYEQWATRYAATARLAYNGPLVARLAPALTLAVSLVGTILIYCSSIAAQISVSQYMAFTSAFGMLLGAFTSLGSTAGSIAQIRPQLENARPIFEQVPEVCGAKILIDHPTGAIELTDVSFAYEGSSKPVLEHLSLSIRPGEYVALVGASGCGKSTIMRLMLGFERPQQGTVCYDGHDIAGVDVHDLRRHIGVVLQQTQLFRGDLYSNIVISAPWLGEEDAWRAAEAAGIADDIRAIPMGMHAIVSEGGAGFSGGQRQRIAIARALVAQPDIIMFDEATSALDNETQQVVAESLDALGCTRIVIAHRISTIRNCDRICMIEGGRVVEEGSYDELMAARGAFYELVCRQEA
ncbi:MAG: ATP-binding cassette domain-containing protein [Coriobacteriales bacterium]|nr:ATP-binding cassette domain-containing protein [Coriobacteriales bacterium]